MKLPSSEWLTGLVLADQVGGDAERRVRAVEQLKRTGTQGAMTSLGQEPQTESSASQRVRLGRSRLRFSPTIVWGPRLRRAAANSGSTGFTNARRVDGIGQMKARMHRRSRR